MFSSPEEAERDIAATGPGYRLLMFSKAQQPVASAQNTYRATRQNPSPRKPFTDVLRVNRHARTGSLRNLVMRAMYSGSARNNHADPHDSDGAKDRVTYLKNALNARFFARNAQNQPARPQRHGFTTPNSPNRTSREHLG